MLDMLLAQKALRDRLLGTVVATTGSTTLSTTTTKFVRTTGSFIDDKFEVGMEITGVGFNAGNNAPQIIKNRYAMELEVEGALTAQTATAGRSLTAGIPTSRAWDNIIPRDDWSPGTHPRIAEQFVPGTARVFTTATNGGMRDDRGLYILTWYGLTNKGYAAIRRSIEAIRARFTPGTTVMAGSNAVTVTQDPGPSAGQIIPLDNGWAICSLTIPWRCYSRNVVAA